MHAATEPEVLPGSLASEVKQGGPSA
jgi:hypothetical protein